MDKAKTLEVLRGMKFMQRKEEAKRRATFEVAQRDEIERQLLRPGGDAGSAGATGSRRGLAAGTAAAPTRATVLYDDSFPAHAYSFSRRSFTETLGGAHDDDPLASSSIDGTAQLDGGAIEQAIPLHDAAAASTSSLSRGHAAGGGGNGSAGTSGDDDEEIEDLWGGEEDAEDPTAAPARRHARRGDASHEGEHGDGRFVIQSSVRAPKLPRRLQETVEEEERQRKRRRAEEQEGGR